MSDGEGGWIYFMTWTELQGITVTANSYPGWNPDYSSFLNSFNHGYWGQGVDVEVDMGGGGENCNTLNRVNQTVNMLGFTVSSGEYSHMRNGNWRGMNGKWYSMNWGGNQWTGPRTKVTTIAGNLKVVGSGLFVVGTGVSLMQGGSALVAGDYEGAAKSAFDIGMGVFATYGGVPGWIIGGGYLILDSFGAFDGPVAAPQIPYLPVSIAPADNTYLYRPQYLK